MTEDGFAAWRPVTELFAEHDGDLPLGRFSRFNEAAAFKATDEIREARAYGATIFEHKPGYMTVIKKRARDDAAMGDALLLPAGLWSQEAVDMVAAQARGTKLPRGTKRIVVCGGSGITAAGVLLGTRRLPVLVVEVGMSTAKTLLHFAEKEFARAEIVPASGPYTRPAKLVSLGSLPLDPFYEAKCLPHLRDGDLLWNTGHRAGPYAVVETVSKKKGRTEVQCHLPV